jgi:hypothetical protein
MKTTQEDIYEKYACGWCIPFEAQIAAEISNTTLTLNASEIALYKAEATIFEETIFQQNVSSFHRASLPSLPSVVCSLQSSLSPSPSLPPTWLAPVAAFWQSLLSRLEDPALSDAVAAETARESIARIPDLIEAMDAEALTELFEAAMGQAAVISMRERLRVRAGLVSALTALSATGPTIEGVAFAPMAEAVAKLERKTAITAALDSEQWRRVPLELRERAFFSARVESARFLSVAQRKLQHRLKLATEQLENGKTAFVNRDSFIRDMRRIAEEEGLQTTGPAGRGTVRDIRSVKRLGLIYDIQTESAAGYARWKVDTDQDVLDEFPAYRLGPSTANQPRPESYWRERWGRAGASVGWQGASRTSMVALKTSPIWAALSVFNTPWPPFDYGSTRMLEDIDRDTAAALGLVPRTGPVPRFGQSGATPEAFNDTLRASVTGWRPDQIATLKSAFGDQVQEQAGKLVWQGNLIQDFADRAILDRAWNGKAVSLGKATDHTIRLANAAGVDLVGAELKIDPSHIRKTWRDHGPRNAYEPGSGEYREGHLPLQKQDYELIPHLWRTPDSITKGDHDTDIVVKKNVGNRLVGAAWKVSPDKKAFILKSIYKWK